MRERPMLFSAPMVRAILAGEKTQTRRVVKPQPAEGCRYEINGAQSAACHIHTATFDEKRFAHAFVPATPKNKDHLVRCPYGQPGDRLWVREAWAADGESIIYRASDPEYRIDRWRPSIHMPRWASRITLEVTSVRVERLQAISEADAIAEGVTADAPMRWWSVMKKGGHVYHFLDCEKRRATLPVVGVDDVVAVELGEPCPAATARDNFRTLWISINGAESWDANPYVWCVSFKRVETLEGSKG